MRTSAKKTIMWLFVALTAICLAMGAVFGNAGRKASADGDDNLTATKVSVSEDKAHMLLVTVIKDVTDVYEVGYDFGTALTEEEKEDTATDKYYTSITSGENTWTAKDIFGDEYSTTDAMIVWQIKYSPLKAYTYTAYYIEGTRYDDVLYKNDTDEKKSGTARTTEIGAYTVTYDTDGGDAMEPSVVPVGTSSSELANVIPTKANYDFIKWQLKTGEDTYVDFDGTETISENITVKAVWHASDIRGAMTVNGKDYTGSLASFRYNETTGYYDAVAGQKEVYYKDKANGDYVAYFDLHTFNFAEGATGMTREAGIVIHGGAPTGTYESDPDANLKIWMGTNPAGNASLFFQANTQWSTECHIGAKLSTFINPAAMPTAADTTLRLAIVRANNALSVYVKTYSDDDGATVKTYENWMLLVRFKADKTYEVGPGVTKNNSSNPEWIYVVNRTASLITATEHMFAYSVGNGSGANGVVDLGYKLVLEQEATDVSDFLATAYDPEYTGSITVNGKNYTAGTPDAFVYNSATGYYEENLVYGNKEAYLKEKANGDYVAYFDLHTYDFTEGATGMKREAGLVIHGGAPTGDYASAADLNFRIWMGVTACGSSWLFTKANDIYATEGYIGGNQAAFINPAANPTAEDTTLRLAIVRADDSLAIYAKTYSMDSGATILTHTKWYLLVKFHSDATVEYGEGARRNTANGLADLTGSIAQLIAAPEHMFALSVGTVSDGANACKLGYKLDLEQGAQAISDFEDNMFVSDITGSITVNGKAYTAGNVNAADPTYFQYNPETGYYEENATKGSQSAFLKQKVTGDYVAFLSLRTFNWKEGATVSTREAGFMICAGAPTVYTGDADNSLRIWMGTGPAGKLSLFFAAGPAVWHSENHFGNNAASFYNPAADPNAEDNTLDLAIVRANGSLYIYVKTYSTDGGATVSTYENWNLLVRFGNDGSDYELGEGVKRHNYSMEDPAFLLNRVMDVVKASENGFGFVMGSGATSAYGFKMSVDDSDARAAAFVANPEAIE